VQNLQKGEHGNWLTLKNMIKKNLAMKEEYKLKKNYKLRNKIKMKVLN